MTVFRPPFSIILALSLGAPGLFAQKAVFLDSFGAQGTGDGQFLVPNDIAVDSSGEVYVVDMFNNRVQRFTGDGTFLSKFGTAGAGIGQFNKPFGIWKSPGISGDVFVSDTENHRVWRIGGGEFPFFEAQFGSLGGGNGQFNFPAGICHSAFNDEVYVVDYNNDRIQRFTTSWTYLGQWGGPGFASGNFDEPLGIAVNPTNGTVYVTEEGNDRIQRFSPTGAFQMGWGSEGNGPGEFKNPGNPEVGGSGFVYVPDSDNDRVQVFTANGRFLHTIGTTGSGAGQFFAPNGVGLGLGLLYVVDGGLSRVSRFRLTDEVPKLVVKGAKSRTVASSSLRLSGTARDDLKVDFVEVKVGSSPFRKAKGSVRWTFTARGLKPGLNRIQVRAVDLGGRKSKIQTLRVSRS